MVIKDDLVTAASLQARDNRMTNHRLQDDIAAQRQKLF